MSDKKGKLIISESISYKTLLLKSFENFGGIESIIKKDDKVFIKIDLSFPEGYPSIVNPKLMKNLIEICLSASPSEIAIGGINSSGISTEFMWKSFGFSDIFENNIIHFIPLDSTSTEKIKILVKDEEHEFPKIVKDSDVYFSLVNPRLNRGFDLELSIYNSYIDNSKSDVSSMYGINQNNEDFNPGQILTNKCKELIEYHSVKIPDFVILDFNHILSTPNFQFYSDSYCIDPNITIVSNNGFLADYIALELCGFEPKKNPLIKTIEKLKGKIIDSDKIDRIVFLKNSLKKNENFEEINFTKAYLKHNKERSDLKDKSQIDITEKDTQFPAMKNFPVILDESDIFPNKVNICKGNTCFGCDNAIYNIIYNLKTIFLKDVENLDQFSILLGKNPPEPKSKDNIIVFGDCAINSTSESDFRHINIINTLKTEEEYLTERVRYEAEIRNKILEWDRKKAGILENIETEIVDEEEKQKTIESLEKKDRKINNAFDKKLKKFVEKQTKSMEKTKSRRTIEEKKPNKSILEIQGCPPKFIFYLNSLKRIFKKKWSPTLEYYSSYFKKILIQNIILDKKNENLDT